MWIDPIFDRTAADVAAGAEKCYFSPALLNRIEGNTKHLAEIFGIEITTKKWSAYDFLTPEQMRRILDNIEKVITAYYAMPGSPGVPSLPATHWNDVNDMEEILWGIKELWERNQKNEIYAGELWAGQMIGVI